MHNDAVCSGFTQIHHRRGELQDVELGAHARLHSVERWWSTGSTRNERCAAETGMSKTQPQELQNAEFGATFLRESDQQERRNYRCPPGLDWMCIADAMERRSSTQTSGAWPDSLSVTLHCNDGGRDEVWSMMPGLTRSKQPRCRQLVPSLQVLTTGTFVIAVRNVAPAKHLRGNLSIANASNVQHRGIPRLEHGTP
jgi:hypothetical protein